MLSLYLWFCITFRRALPVALSLETRTFRGRFLRQLRWRRAISWSSGKMADGTCRSVSAFCVWSSSSKLPENAYRLPHMQWNNWVTTFGGNMYVFFSTTYLMQGVNYQIISDLLPHSWKFRMGALLFLLYRFCSHKLNSTSRPESASELYRPSDLRLLAKLVPTFADRQCHMVSAP
jgi:hypothetical protein